MAEENENVRVKDFVETVDITDLTGDDYLLVDRTNGTGKIQGNAIAPRSGSTTEIRNFPDKYEGYLALNDANGTGKFPIDNIIGSIAEIYYPEAFGGHAATNAVAGKLYMYQGKCWLCKENTSGAWNADKFKIFNLERYIDSMSKSMSASLAKTNNVLYEQGGIDTNGEELVRSNRIRTKFIEVDGLVFVKLNAALGENNVRIYIYDESETFISYSSITSDEYMSIEPGHKVRFLIYRTDDLDILPDYAKTVGVYVSGLKLDSSNSTSGIDKSVSKQDVVGLIHEKNRLAPMQLVPRFILGVINKFDGSFVESIYRYVTRYFYAISDMQLFFDFMEQEHFYIRVCYFDENYDYLNYWEFTSSRTVTCPVGTAFVKVAIIPTDDAYWDIDVLYKLNLSVSGIVLDETNSDIVFKRPMRTKEIDDQIFFRGQLLGTSRVLKWVVGTINQDGTDVASTTRLRTDIYYVVQGNVKIEFTPVANTRVRYFIYNDSDVYVSNGYADVSGTVVSVTSGYKMRFVLVTTDNRTVDLSLAVAVGMTATNLVLDDTNSDLVFSKQVVADSEYPNLAEKTVAFIGDSITYGVGSTDGKNYVNDFAELTGCTSVNLGYNGTCIAVGSKKVPNNDDHCFVTRATQANIGNADIIVVFGGTNDFSYNSKPIGNSFVEETITAHDNIGSKQIVPPTDKETFSGALHDLIQTIQTNSKQGAILLLITPMQRKNYVSYNPNSAQSNSNGDFMMDYVKSIKEIGSFYSVPVLDMYSDAEFCRLSPYFDNYFPDGIHPNNAGHLIIAKKIAKFVKDNLII